MISKYVDADYDDNDDDSIWYKYTIKGMILQLD